MREAWRHDPQLRLDPKKFPPRVRQLYDEAKAEAQKASAPPTKPPAAATAPTPEKKGGGAGKAVMIGLGVAAVGGGVAAAASGGGGSGGPTSTTPPTMPSGTFTVLSSTPGFGATVTGAETDLQGTRTLTVTFQWTYSSSISSLRWVLELLSGSTECLRTAIDYSSRTDGGPRTAYVAGTSATYSSSFFLRDFTLPSCGSRFTTDRIRFILIDGSNRTLFTQDATGGWTFQFAR
jgi:hypothetical protein